jgi:hypothetical protein
LHIALPETDDFLKGDLRRDPSADLAKAETAKKEALSNLPVSQGVRRLQHGHGNANHCRQRLRHCWRETIKDLKRICGGVKMDTTSSTSKGDLLKSPVALMIPCYIFMFMLGIWAALALHLPQLRSLEFLPNRTPDFWITLPITFAASMQVLTFRTVGPHTYTSTFTTGNLGTLSTGLFDWLFTNDKEAARSKSRIFAIIAEALLPGPQSAVSR